MSYLNGSVWQRQHFLDMEENRWDDEDFHDWEIGRDLDDEQAFTVESLAELERRLDVEAGLLP